jgi:hypothetical protein
MSGHVCPLCEAPWRKAEGTAACLFCSTGETAEFRCANGHYVCEGCRTDDPREVVARICHRSNETDPLTLWHLVTAHGAFRGHGPQFHFVLAPVLVAVLRNRGLADVSAEQVEKVVGRLSEIPAVSCAETGLCGAGACAGAVVSLLNGATPVSDGERRAVLRASGQAMLAIARHPGGRCCRQSALATLEAVWAFLREDHGLPLEPVEVRCYHFSRVADCKEGCSYHA